MDAVLFMAMSVNGTIARNNDSEDFLSHYGWEKFVFLAKKYGNFIIGRRTLEVVRREYIGFGFDYLEHLDKIVVSSQYDYEPGDGYHLVKSPQEAVEYLESKGHNLALLTGGATLNGSFAEAGLLSRVVINVEPVVVASGKTLFNSKKLDMDLELEDTETSDNGVLTMQYKVK